MTAPLTLIEQLKRDEGLRLFPYKDTVGKLTIGYGRNLEDVGISKEEAEFLLSNDIEVVRRELGKALPWYKELNHSAREGVLENMAFNLGIRKLLEFTRTLEAMKAGEHNQAAAHMLESLWARQVGKRAQRLAEQWRTGVWI